jgi:hypothetical protein
MALHALRLAFPVLFISVQAAPLQPSPATSTPSGWSTEAIIALISVFVAVTGILITLIASSRSRRSLKRECRDYRGDCAWKG